MVSDEEIDLKNDRWWRELGGNPHFDFWEMPEDPFPRFANWWAIRENTLLRTTDGGTSWVASVIGENSGTPVMKNIFFLNTRKGWYLGPEGDVGWTEDGGVTWRSGRQGPSECLTSVAFADTLNGWVTSENSVYHTTNGGASWVKQFSDSTGESFSSFFNVSVESKQRCNIAGYRANSFRTIDGGKSWQKMSGLAKRNILHLAFVDSRFGWAVGEGGVICKTIDGGNSWVDCISGTTAMLIKLIACDRQTAITYGLDARYNSIPVFLYTTDGGENWERYESDSTLILETTAKNLRDDWYMFFNFFIEQSSDGHITIQRKKIAEEEMPRFTRFV